MKCLVIGGAGFIGSNLVDRLVDDGYDVKIVDNLSTVPVIALALGPVAGLGEARAVTSHISIMVKEISQMFVAGPPVVKRVGEELTKEELGGAEIHSKNGAIDLVVKSEKEAINITKDILSYLP